jgi:hypothetical protein
MVKKSILFLSLPLLLLFTTVQATSIFYDGVDGQGKPVRSEMVVINQNNGVFAIRIYGGMPDLSYTGQPYINTYFFGSLYRIDEVHNSIIGSAVFSQPFLYVFSSGKGDVQKVIYDTEYVHIFQLDEEGNFKLNSVQWHGIFCDNLSCELKSDLFQFDGSVIYTLKQ